MKLPFESLDLELAYRRIKQDLRSDFIDYPIEVQVFDSRSSENLAQLEEEIRDEYAPDDLRRIDVPKQNRTLRPGAVPLLRDRIVMQALVNAIAEHVEDNLVPISEKAVFSHRVKRNGDGDMFERGGYTKFEEKTLEGVRSGRKYLLVTDIAAYYEYIDIGILAATMSGFGIDQALITSILAMINRWNGARYRSLPQGPWPSNLLGNLYLDPLDKFMLRQGYDYFRYGDDIRIFADSKVELNKALRDLCIQLRTLGVTLQTEKTQRLYGRRLVEFVNYRHNRLQDFVETLPPQIVVDFGYGGEVQVDEVEATVSEVEESEELLVKFLVEHVFRSEDSYDARMLRYCIGLLTRMGSSAAADEALRWLPQLPAETKLFVRYLETSDDFTEISNSMIAYVASDENIYDWSEMWVLEYLRSARARWGSRATLSEDNMSVARQIARDRNKHWICRFKAIQICGQQGDDPERRSLMFTYDDEQRQEIQSAIVLACEGLNRIEHNRFYQLCRGKGKDANALIQYITNRRPNSLS